MAENHSGDSIDASQDFTTQKEPSKIRKRRTTEHTPPSREAGEVPTGMFAMSRVFAHPLRVKIMYAMNGPERRASASSLEAELRVDLKRLSYHMRELAAMGFIQQVDERPVRGSLEKIYAPNKRLEAWDLEWSTMPAKAKATIAAHTLGLGVRAAGVAIDSGDFGKRDDSVLSQSTIWADERGAVEALGELFKAAEALVRIEAEMKARLEESGDSGFPISYVIAGFEGGLRPIE